MFSTPNSKEGDDGHIFIADIQNRDACNQDITGSFWWDGVEYSFYCQSGNNAGFVWCEVSADEPIPDIEIHQTKWTIQPQNLGIDGDTVERMAEQAKLRLAVWDVFLKRTEVIEKLKNYMYDKHFAPGGRTENYYRDWATSIKAEIVTEETAKETRRYLERISTQEAVLETKDQPETE